MSKRPDSIDAADVGCRVVVRRRLPGQTGPTGGQAYTDVLGVLELWDSSVLRVRRADASSVDIPRSDVAFARPIPAPPMPRGQRRPSKSAEAD